MKQPEYVRGAWFASHVHYWERKTGRACVPWFGRHNDYTYSAIVWYKRRRKVLND